MDYGLALRSYSGHSIDLIFVLGKVSMNGEIKL